MPFEHGVFDHIVCFETIEHIEPDREFLIELRRLLASDGHMLISTPNRAVTSPNDARPLSPFHVREYLLPEFCELLRSAGFAHLDVHYQCPERRRAPEYLASAVIARNPWLCQPGRWWDRLAHGSDEVLQWTEGVTHPEFWVIDCR
jgi:SAM-dependent methyltransferase